MENNVFQLLGIEDRELPISNLLSYYLNPVRNKKYGLAFLNEFCKLAGIGEIAETDSVTVEREVFLPFEGGKNYIDILICIGDDYTNPERIICIENKINATEGILQTKRYYEALEARFADCGEKDYIYLTKNNSSVNLSSCNFRHIRYAELGRLLSDNRFVDMPLAKDFSSFYVLREQSRFIDVEENDRPYLFCDKKDFMTLIDYLVWKINTTETSELHRDVFCMHGKSAKSDEHFFKLSMKNWEFEFDGQTAVHPINIHLEGRCRNVLLHMELEPYEPYSKIKEKYGKAFFELYKEKRDELRRKISFEIAKKYYLQPIAANADLTIAKFTLHVKSYREYYNALMELIVYVNQILAESSVIENV